MLKVLSYLIFASIILTTGVTYAFSNDKPERIEIVETWNNNWKGIVDRATAVMYNDCTAKFKGTILRGEVVEVSEISFMRQGIMGRYYIPKYKAWFYETSFEDFKCN